MLKKRFISLICVILCLCTMILSVPRAVRAENSEDQFVLNCKSAVLMEASTGKVLFAQNPDEALPPASVTKIMTLVLVMEAIEEGRLKWDDQVVTSDRAASMGGSQIYLEVGETMSVEDMVKSVVIASANDAACALAERVAGSEEAFVKRMNERARELGMVNTRFENTNGLDDTATEHLTSALDIAIMSKELIKHKKILEYSSIWMDTVRNGEFGLTNTNRLVRFYKGCTGLKTGSTSKAGFCISATAERDGMSLICVIMGAETRDIRNSEAAKLLDWGYANYSLFTHDGGRMENVEITGGNVNCINVNYPKFTAVVPAGKANKVEVKISVPDMLSAPLKKGEIVGKVSFLLDGETLGEVNAVSECEVESISYFQVFIRMLAKFLLL